MDWRILLTGGTGQLGTELIPRLSRLGTVISPRRPELDLAAAEATARIVALRPTHVVHAAAATDVERCEQDPAWAYAVNAEGTCRVAQACRAVGAWLLYVSTDYVFDGNTCQPYREGEPPAPMNVYGRSKLAGEVRVQALVPQSAVVRTAWVYGHVGRNFVATVLQRLQAGEVLTVVTDQVGSPSYASDLAEGIAQLVARGATGVFHLTNSGSCSWFELAQAIAQEIGSDPARVLPITSATLGLRARRPAYSVLANAAWKALGLSPLRPWDAALHARLARDGMVKSTQAPIAHD
jgi:dTDP-4-dehydrorhamnose reductase